MAASMTRRTRKGLFKKRRRLPLPSYLEDHNYASHHTCNSVHGCEECCPGITKILKSKKISLDQWRNGRRVIELEVFVNNLKSCSKCLMGPLFLTERAIKGEMKLGLGGFIYIQCGNCLFINRVPYGSTHKLTKTKGMPNFSINTKIGTAMIDSVGGPQKMNNLLATLNLPSINERSLKVMEKRAGKLIENFADESMRKESQLAYDKEMEHVSNEESEQRNHMFHEELGVAFIDGEFTGNKHILADLHQKLSSDDESESTPKRSVNRPPKKRPLATEHSLDPPKKKLKYLPMNRTGMTVCADHEWQKRGYDSLTGHTFFISKQKKVLKTIVKHRTCGRCKWWRSRRPGVRPPMHTCVWNHHGSSKLMESEAGLQAIQEMAKQGTPVQIIEGDGDNTLISRAENQLGVSLTKKLDKNHCVKNIVKTFYDIRNQKVKISNQVITHLTKCLKYVFAKNQGNLENMRENLVALVPHQFGDHSKCHARFCGFKRSSGAKYIHRSLPYKVPLQDPLLHSKLTEVFVPVIEKAALYADLGCSQACEHANRAVSLRAPKHLHYGESDSLDFRVKAAAAYINEGRRYLSEVAGHAYW